MAKGNGFIVPTDARAEYRALIQRANRRILANINYIKDEGITDNSIKNALVGDYGSKRKWATKSAPLSASTKFNSAKEYRQFINFINRWGKDTGRRGGFAADPKERVKFGQSQIYKAIYGMIDNKGISLEEWKGDLPPDIKKEIENLSLQQINKFFDYTDVTGEDSYFDSDSPEEDTAEDVLDYIRGRISAVKQYYPRPQKKQKKKKGKKNTRRKTKGRKKL